MRQLCHNNNTTKKEAMNEFMKGAVTIHEIYNFAEGPLSMNFVYFTNLSETYTVNGLKKFNGKPPNTIKEIQKLLYALEFASHLDDSKVI